MDRIREYREWMENNRPQPPPAELPNDKESLKGMIDEWTAYEAELYPEGGLFADVNERYMFNVYGGIEEVRLARVHIKKLNAHIKNIDKKRIEDGRSLVKTSVFIPRTKKEMLNIFPQRIIQEMIKNINTSKALAKSPPKSSLKSPSKSNTPFYPPPSVMKSSPSVKKSVKGKSVKKDSDSISRNQPKEKLISIIMDQPDYDVHIEKTLQELSSADANKTIKYFEGLGFGEYFSGKMKLPQKRNAIVVVFKKLTDVNPRKIPLRVARNIEQYLGTRIAGKNKTHKTHKTHTKKKTRKSKK